jgi:hypothetical protein
MPNATAQMLARQQPNNNIGELLGALGQRKNRLASEELLGQLGAPDPNQPESELLQNPSFQRLQNVNPDAATNYQERIGAMKAALKVEDDASLKAFFVDNRNFLNRLEGGDLSGARAVLLNRRAKISQIKGAVPDDVDQLLSMLDAEDFDGAANLARLADQEAVGVEILEPISRADEFKDRELLVDEGGLVLDRDKFELEANAPEDTSEIYARADKYRSEIAKTNQDFTDIANSWDRIAASADDPSAAGDLALIFNYMKMLDPGSTVREGEFANAQNSAGIPTRIRSAYNRARSGERLVEEQREDFFGQAQNIFDASKARADTLQESILGIAEREGIPRDAILVDRGESPTINTEQLPIANTQADFDALPSGALYYETSPDGTKIRYRKP